MNVCDPNYTQRLKSYKIIVHYISHPYQIINTTNVLQIWRIIDFSDLIWHRIQSILVAGTVPCALRHANKGYRIPGGIASGNIEGRAAVR